MDDFDYYQNKIIREPVEIERRLSKLDELFPYFVEALNEIHDLNWPVRSWRIVLYGYVMAALRDIEKGDFKDQSIQDIPIPGMLGKGSSGLKVLQSILIKVKQFKHLPDFIKNKKKLIHLLESKSALSLGYALSYYERKLSVIPRLSVPLFILKKDKRKRQKLNRYLNSVNNKDLKIILEKTPRAYIEYFQSLLNIVPEIDAGNKEFHIERGIPLVNAVFIANYLSLGSKLFFYQPGGWMGELNKNIGYENQNRNSDIFYTYGWRLNKNDSPGKPYRLMLFKERYSGYLTESNRSSSEKKVLIVLSKIHQNNKERIFDFFRKLSKAKNERVKFKIRFRPASRKLKLSVYKKEESFVKSLGFEVDKGFEPMEKAVSEVDLVVHLSTPSTNFLECVYINKPVVSILSNEHPTDIVLNYYNYFLQKNVMFVRNQDLVNWLFSDVDFQFWWDNLNTESKFIEYKKLFTGS